MDVGILKELLSADDEGNLWWKYRSAKYFNSDAACVAWNARWANKQVCKNFGGNRYLRVNILGKRYLTHRVVYAFYHGKWPVENLDHISGDRLDNSPMNLREVPQSVNMKNKKMASNNSSGATGVSWSKYHNKWRCYIGRRHQIGMFDTLDEAVAARLKANIEFGYSPTHGRAH